MNLYGKWITFVDVDKIKKMNYNESVRQKKSLIIARKD